MATVEKAASKYTAEQVARMRAEAPLNQVKAEALATEFGFTVRSVIAKAVRARIEYVAKGKVTKTGAPVEQKEAIVADIASLVGANLAGLEKAPKPALQALRDFLAA
jgi:hypothetical protein